MKPQDFDDFFERLHGYPPFPWQSRLARQVAENGVWPSVLDLPTSAGKTSALDIALFHLALEADKNPRERQAPRRIFFVVDRRLIVDEAYERSKRVAEKLRDALKQKQGIVSDVAQRLARLTSEDDPNPLAVVRLRGGLPHERAFIRNPLQPAIVISTVDQVGSRLLFRGYGVSEFMRPVHAALVGLDSLIILDEAHLSQPFLQTLRWVRRYQSNGWAEQPLIAPVRVVQMTATPPAGESPFALLNSDWEHHNLGKRLKSPKAAILAEIKTDGENRAVAQETLVEALVNEARSLMERQCQHVDAPVVGVVVNRVATARMAFEQLRKNDEGRIDTENAVLLTGRIRPYDRDELLKEYFPRIKAGRGRADNPRPLYVVATQTVEVGADLDFDALVTEAASLDALRQRFGRLNRLGERPHCAAVIVFDKSSPKDDPLYGEALGKTWKWLNEIATKSRGQKRRVVDFGIQAVKAALPEREALQELSMSTPHAPVIMPAHVDMLAQTSPSPAVEPEIANFLHGLDTQPDDVQIVWRADLPASLGPKDDAIIEIITLLPPMRREALSLPVWAVRAFLAGNKDSEVADMEGGKLMERQERQTKGRYAIRWRGPEKSELVEPKKIVPGDILVVPSSYGGLDRFGWNPTWKGRVQDIADQVAGEKNNKTVLRVHSALIQDWFAEAVGPETKAQVIKLLDDALDRYRQDEELSTVCDELIDAFLLSDGLRADVRDALEKYKAGSRGQLEIVYPSQELSKGIVLRQKRNDVNEFTDDDDSSSLTREISLESHCRGVGELANVFATGCGVSSKHIEDAALAGSLHDLGKADPRFQAWLRGGDRAAAREAKELLAKSGMVANDRYSIRIARERAGYPRGGRHECYSVAMLKQHPVLLKSAHDKELVLYLVGAHHGRGRPFMPAIEDNGMRRATFSFSGDSIEFAGQHGLERLGSGWADLFWKLIRRYGCWGLAYLETIVRLADHRRSEREVENERT